MDVPINPCPTCGAQPDIDRCEPDPNAREDLGWYAVCYRMSPFEHCVGVNGDTRKLVIEAWNNETRTQK